MKHRVLLLALTVFLVLALIGCLGTTPPIEPEEPVEVLSAKVKVTDWEQAYTCVVTDDPSDGWIHTYTLATIIGIDYLITNTGTVDIDYSRILFKVTYGGDSIIKDIYIVWLDGIGADVGCYESDCIGDVWVGNREVVDVVAIDWELASYKL